MPIGIMRADAREKEWVLSLIDKFEFFDKSLKQIKETPKGFIPMMMSNYSTELDLVYELKKVKEAIDEFGEENAYKCVPTWMESTQAIIDKRRIKYNYWGVEHFNFWFDIYKTVVVQ